MFWATTLMRVRSARSAEAVTSKTWRETDSAMEVLLAVRSRRSSRRAAADRGAQLRELGVHDEGRELVQRRVLVDLELLALELDAVAARPRGGLRIDGDRGLRGGDRAGATLLALGAHGLHELGEVDVDAAVAGIA